MFPSNHLIKKTFYPQYINKDYIQEQIDPLIWENHFCLLTNLHKFWWNIQKSINIYVEAA